MVVTMVQVGRMRVLVRLRSMLVRVAVLAYHTRTVLVIVMPVIVSMGVFVVQSLMLVAMAVLFRQV